MAKAKKQQADNAVPAAPTPFKSVDLGEGLQLWQVDPAILIEQDLNARTMSKQAFKRLTANIASDKRMESLAFCALTLKGLEVVSGHHRTRAARAAKLPWIWVLVDVTGLSSDQIKSKQLSHNSLQGTDDADLVAQIFGQIKDQDAQLAAFVVEVHDVKVDVPKIDKGALAAGKMPLHRTLTVIFLPAKFAVLKEAIAMVAPDPDDEVWLEASESYELLSHAAKAISSQYNITPMPGVLVKMAELAMQKINDDLVEAAKNG